MTDSLFNLLRRRMADGQVQTDDPVAVAELHKRLLPYHTCRDQLGYATKAEYDVAVLRLLSDEDRVAVAEPALREAVRSEIRQPEPGLSFLHRFAASEIRVIDTAPLPAAASEPVESPAGSPAGSPVDEAGAPRAAGAPVNEDECRSCAAPLPALEGVRFCPACGADQVPPACSSCGAEVGEGWRYCAFCGNVQASDPI